MAVWGQCCVGVAIVPLQVDYTELYNEMPTHDFQMGRIAAAQYGGLLYTYVALFATARSRYVHLLLRCTLQQIAMIKEAKIIYDTCLLCISYMLHIGNVH